MKTSPIETVSKTEAYIKKGHLDKALDTLLIYFRASGDKQNEEEVRVLIGQVAKLRSDKQQGGGYLQKEQNRITDAILSLRNRIIPEDVRLAESPVSVYKNARLLHDIPRSMEVGNPIRCVIRLEPIRAFWRPVFKPAENTSAEKIDRIGGITRLLIKPLHKNDFKVEVLGQADRKIFSDAHTEWNFIVTPLREGRLQLRLDMGMTILHASGEHTLEKMFTEEIEVLTVVTPQEEPMRAVALLQGSPTAISRLPWWMSLLLMSPYAVRSMPRIASIIIGLFFGAKIALLLFPVKYIVLPASTHQFEKPAVTFKKNELKSSLNKGKDTLTVFMTSTPDDGGIVKILDERDSFYGVINTKKRVIQLNRYQAKVTHAQDAGSEHTMFTAISTAAFHPPVNLNSVSRPVEYGVPRNIDRPEYDYSHALDPAVVPASPPSSKSNIAQPTTRVSMSLPKKTRNIQVLVNGRAVKTQLVTRGAQYFVDFTVPRSQKVMVIKATDEYCTYEASGTPSVSTLVLSSQSACSQRLVELSLNKDLGAFLARNKQDVVIEARNDQGERMGVTDLHVANPLRFYVPGSSMQVLIKLKLSSGNAINVCSMTLAAGKQAVIKSTCSCKECATQVK